MFINLLENAIKFTPVAGHIRISAQTDGVFVKFSINDNGPGIPPADRERIFDKFIRVRGRIEPLDSVWDWLLPAGGAWARRRRSGRKRTWKGSTFWLTPACCPKKTTRSAQTEDGRLTMNER
ncbi:MAG: ATP-binding protein [Anaerolineales bacterium]|nr:ATP-binding protein [Anaerolineales bacterium]